MSKGSIKGKVNIISYDELLSGEDYKEKADIVEVPIQDLYEFKNHPFHVVDDEKMEELVESIKEKGVLSPAIVRPREEGGYEIISGHRRRRACELAEMESMPAIIRDLDDDEATILMVDANIQRENILPSERAFAYKMRIKAEKNQGKRTDLTSGQIVPKLISEQIGDEEGMSGRQIKRYVRLTNLLPELLERVDNGKIGFIPAVNISFLKKEEQNWIFAVLKEADKKISLRQSEMLRKSSEEKNLSEDMVCDILVTKKTLNRTVTITESEIKKYFPENMDSAEIKSQIIELIKQWKGESTDG